MRWRTDKKLPIGIQSFKTIREDGYIYVDKTGHIHQMLEDGMLYFLSRPRRFGKSLTVSTLKSLFEGKKELFDGLWISEHGGWNWTPYPVILIDFNGISHDTPENLKKGLASSLNNTGLWNGIQLKESMLKERFKELILALHRKTEHRVVILIDEYDKPLIDHLGKGRESLEIAKENRDILRYFLGVIKDGDVASALRFVFVTGVSKFSRVSIFSELNNLEDISMTERYSDFLGYTQKELEDDFAPFIAAMSEKTRMPKKEMLQKLTFHYDGYRFSKGEATVYNPFSILQAFQHQDFGHYWFETATPTFLVNLLREKNYRVPELENLQVTESMFSTFDIDRLKTEALLFQTGYVTIKDVQDRLFTLGYPNGEVKTAFLEILLQSFAGETNGADTAKYALLSAYLRNEDFDAFFGTVSALFASIPYTLESKRDEAYFHTLFYLMVSASGVDARTEVLTSRGRIDLVVEFPEKVYIIEFKCGQSADAALKQIRDMSYPQKFQESGKKRILMGVNFDTDKRNISEWKSEIIP